MNGNYIVFFLAFFLPSMARAQVVNGTPARRELNRVLADEMRHNANTHPDCATVDRIARQERAALINIGRDAETQLNHTVNDVRTIMAQSQHQEAIREMAESCRVAIEVARRGASSPEAVHNRMHEWTQQNQLAAQRLWPTLLREGNIRLGGCANRRFSSRCYLDQMDATEPRFSLKIDCATDRPPAGNPSININQQVDYTLHLPSAPVATRDVRTGIVYASQTTRSYQWNRESATDLPATRFHRYSLESFTGASLGSEIPESTTCLLPGFCNTLYVSTVRPTDSNVRHHTLPGEQDYVQLIRNVSGCDGQQHIGTRPSSSRSHARHQRSHRSSRNTPYVIPQQMMDGVTGFLRQVHDSSRDNSAPAD